MAPAGSCGFALCAFCLLVLFGRGAFCKLATLFLLAAAKLFRLPALLRFLFRSAAGLLLLATCRPSAALLCGFSLGAFGFLALLRRGAFSQLAVLLLFAPPTLFLLLTFLGFTLV